MKNNFILVLSHEEITFTPIFHIDLSQLKLLSSILRQQQTVIYNIKDKANPLKYNHITSRPKLSAYKSTSKNLHSRHSTHKPISFNV
jgi:hypothetical protein